jgi:hypothetical protein
MISKQKIEGKDLTNKDKSSILWNKVFEHWKNARYRRLRAESKTQTSLHLSFLNPFFRHWRKETFMKTFFAALVAAILLSLTACGGGGDGPTTPPPPVQVTVTCWDNTQRTAADIATALALCPVRPVATLALKSSSISNGTTGVAQSGTHNFTFTFSNASGFETTLDVLCNGSSVRTGRVIGVPASGEVTVSVTYANAPLGAVCQYSGALSGKGANSALDPAPVSISGAFTVTSSIKYGETILGYWGGTNGLPRKTILETGVQVPMVNKTRYASFLNCQPATNMKNADGTIPHSCFATFGSDRYVDLALNPVTMEMVDAPAPVGAVYLPLNQGITTVPADKQSLWLTAARLSNGDYVFVNQASKSVVRRVTSADVESVVYLGSFAVDNSCVLLMVFSNQ